MRWMAGWAAIALLALPSLAFSAPVQDGCMANATASLIAFVHGDYAGTGKDFSPQLAKALPAAKLAQTWGEVQKRVGAYQSHGVAHRQSMQGKSTAVVPVKFAQSALDFVATCDASNRISAFYLLNPAVVEAARPVKAQTTAAGVRVEPLNVPSPVGPLRGALTFPASQGPFPAVVLVAGSGAHDLDETVEGNKPFRDIAEGLAKAGIASLRYDKRTFDYAQQVALNPDFTIDDEVTNDALTALHLLAKQSRIDPRRVFVLGHSLGAQMAPRIAQRDPQLAGVIMLAAPARSFLVVVAAQIRELGSQQGMSAAEVDKREKAIAAELKLLDASDAKNPPKGSFELLPGRSVSQVYLLSLHDVRQVATARSLTLPMLVLQGANDFQVSPTLGFDAWKAALAGKRNVRFRLYPGLSHLFTPGPTKSPADYTTPAHVDPEVIADIANWIKAQPAN
ncbi:MAG: alpha/beta hydrolase family protein [Rhodanobacteraceae bacterium]